MPKRIPSAKQMEAHGLIPGGYRTVCKNGIHYGGDTYWDDALSNLVGHRMYVCGIEGRDGVILCFELSSKRFVCEATEISRLNLTLEERISMRRAAQRRARELWRPGSSEESTPTREAM